MGGASTALNRSTAVVPRLPDDLKGRNPEIHQLLAQLGLQPGSLIQLLNLEQISERRPVLGMVQNLKLRALQITFKLVEVVVMYLILLPSKLTAVFRQAPEFLDAHLESLYRR